MAQSTSLVSIPPSQNSFQGIFWCCPGSCRRLCDSNGYCICRTDSILNISLTFFTCKWTCSILLEHLERKLKSNQENLLHGSFSCPFSFPFSIPSFHNWRSTLPSLMENIGKEEAHTPPGEWQTTGGDSTSTIYHCTERCCNRCLKSFESLRSKVWKKKLQQNNRVCDKM